MPTIFHLGEILAKREMTQAELFRLSGVPLRTISRLCRNETAQVSLDTLDRLATALGVKPGDLIVQEKGKRVR